LVKAVKSHLNDWLDSLMMLKKDPITSETPYPVSQTGNTSVVIGIACAVLL